MSNIECLYHGKNQRYINRKEKISLEFFNIYKEYPNFFISSPGRVEVLGNHTDHNNGKVLVSSIDLDILAAIKKRNDGKILFKSQGYSINGVDVNELDIKKDEFGKSNALIRGIVSRFVELGYKVGGFEGVSDSRIFKGAGLSSSAAFELLIGNILNYLYNDNSIDKVELAKIGQYAENVYFNKPSGLLDQMGISLGGFNYIDFKDTESPIIKNFKFLLKDYRVVLVNTGGSHSHLTQYYKSIKDDMKAVSNFFNKDVLREVSEDDFYANLKTLNKKVGGRAINRAIHYFEENKRVDKAFEALNNNDVKTFLNMINESGESSYKLLQNCFIEKDKKQGIALALSLSKKMITDGACRVHGGGFKGTVIAYVSVKEQAKYINLMKEVFGERNVSKVTFREIGTAVIEE